MSKQKDQLPEPDSSFYKFIHEHSKISEPKFSYSQILHNKFIVYVCKTVMCDIIRVQQVTLILLI